MCCSKYKRLTYLEIQSDQEITALTFSGLIILIITQFNYRYREINSVLSDNLVTAAKQCESMECEDEEQDLVVEHHETLCAEMCMCLILWCVVWCIQATDEEQRGRQKDRKGGRG